MADTYLNLGGTTTDPADLTLRRAVELVGVLPRLEYVRLVECLRFSGTAATGAREVVVLDLDVERPQVPVHDIRRTERVAVTFAGADDTFPVVESLRPDFPAVPHLNFGFVEFPRSLCLYDRSWEEVKVRWTAAAFVERIRRWLADTADGTLHRGDQPLEPLLFGNGYQLILPHDVFDAASDALPDRLDIRLVQKKYGGVFLAEPAAPNPAKGTKYQFVATLFLAPPQTHGRIRHAPRTLHDLDGFLAPGGTDLIGILRDRLKGWTKPEPLLDAALILVVAFPLTREDGGDIQATDLWAFLTTKTVREVGTEIGLWGVIDGKVGMSLRPDDTMRGQGVPLEVLRPQFAFSRSAAAAASGLKADPCRTVVVGVGALGSQVVVNLHRSGFGRWTVVDEDDLLPHNLARHVLPRFFVGHPKAEAMALFIDELYPEERHTLSVAADVLDPGDQSPPLADAFKEAELILDVAASLPVARHLAVDLEAPARRVSLFLNPRGTDLVCLAEDAQRAIPLDCIEAQYYRAVASDPAFESHLASNEDRLRYARSCRDVSAVLPTHLVALHGAVGSQAVRAVRASTEASIRVWRADPATMAVSVLTVPVYPVRRTVLGDWTLVVDEWLFVRLRELRAGRLPNETGGVLLGMYDLTRRTVYVVDTIPSPPDSKEWPTLYIRGSEGLSAGVTDVTKRTAGQLEYVGEWHSHPDGCGCDPSTDDLTVFTWLTDHLAVAGLPALMAIIGQGDASRWFLGEMLRTGVPPGA